MKYRESRGRAVSEEGEKKEQEIKCKREQEKDEDGERWVGVKTEKGR